MELKATAYHEAGHAVATMALGRSVRRISIVEDGRTLGRVEHRRRPQRATEALDARLIDADYASAHGGFIDAKTRRTVETEVIVSLAGAEAERMSSGVENRAGAGFILLSTEAARKVGWGEDAPLYVLDGDIETVVTLTERVSGTEAERQAYELWLLERTRSLFQDPMHWAMVEGLAAALLERRIMTGAEVRQVVEDARIAWAESAFGSNAGEEA